MPAPPSAELPIVQFPDEAAWEAWLTEKHDRVRGAWLKMAKRGVEPPTITYAGALDVAICFGWIDGQVRRFDERFFLQRFTPRGPRSRWSQRNTEHAERLIAAGRMREPGLAQIRAAQADGRWEQAYPSQNNATVPDDLQAALDRVPEAKAFFETLTGSRRYAFLYRLHNVRTPPARERRIASYIDLLREGRTLN